LEGGFFFFTSRVKRKEELNIGEGGESGAKIAKGKKKLRGGHRTKKGKVREGI